MPEYQPIKKSKSHESQLANKVTDIDGIKAYVQVFVYSVYNLCCYLPSKICTNIASYENTMQ